MNQSTHSNTASLGISKEIMGEAVCKWCKRTFETEVYIFSNGRTMKAGICNPCAEEREAKVHPDVVRAKRDVAWGRMVGGYFHIFDPNRIPTVMLPHFEDALTWKPTNTRGIGFMGKSRSAKSKVITELGRRLYITGTDVFPTSGVEFQEKVVAQVEDREGFGSYIQRVKTCHVLLLDDADKLKLTEAVEAAYYSMLEYRRRFQKPVLVTVNLNGQQMAAAASENRGEPIINRLRDVCEIIELK